MLTLASVFVAVLLGMAIGVLLGTIGYRSRIANSILTPLYDVMQTTPIFAYLVPVLVFFGFGPVAALLATIMFAMPPMARVTTLALQRVPGNTQDFGATRAQKLFQVQIPLALPDIMLGINQVLMMAFGMLVITSLVGTRGLEHEALFSLGKVQPGRGIVSGLGIAFLSIMADRMITAGSIHMRRRLGLAPRLAAV